MTAKKARQKGFAYLRKLAGGHKKLMEARSKWTWPKSWGEACSQAWEVLKPHMERVLVQGEKAPEHRSLDPGLYYFLLEMECFSSSRRDERSVLIVSDWNGSYHDPWYNALWYTPPQVVVKKDWRELWDLRLQSESREDALLAVKAWELSRKNQGRWPERTEY